MISYTPKQRSRAAAQWVSRTSPHERPEMQKVLANRLMEAIPGSYNYHILILQCEANVARKRK